MFKLFSYASLLQTVVIPSSIITMGIFSLNIINSYYSFNNPGYSVFECATVLSSVTLVNGLTNLGEAIFVMQGGNCALKSVTIVSTITSIGAYAFSGISSLTSITLVPGLPTVAGTFMFNNAVKVASLTIPASVSSIGNYHKNYTY
jgi:hypothetical protein